MADAPETATPAFAARRHFLRRFKASTYTLAGYALAAGAGIATVAVMKLAIISFVVNGRGLDATEKATIRVLAAVGVVLAAASVGGGISALLAFSRKPPPPALWILATALGITLGGALLLANLGLAWLAFVGGFDEPIRWI